MTMRSQALALALVTFGGTAAAQPPAVNDYPTDARAEYVFACMATNGQTQDALRRCSCSIDAIASILPYDRYVSAETVLRMRQGAGERAAMFRGGTPATSAILADLRRAQAEAEMLCF
ncbi:hypothetical protein CDV54_15840 [Paracoccus yeei]|nr:hypothetical protein CDV54_15840 [Paracoccus yeei]